ncbi:MAG: EAL domain-containing protein [Oscillatoria sp. PMC 1068.18]|nr:EAL domain-containing protein [Oscillatoria sp. PMC 1076.18]MEC4990824.1 EAL domain-containing protein [Oscillatoria sp. PMC 1068.18]
MNNQPLLSLLLTSTPDFVGIYTFLANLWISFFEVIEVKLTNDLVLLSKLQSIKGWALVFVTSCLLYLLFSYQQRKKSESLTTITEAEFTAWLNAVGDLVLILDKQGCCQKILAMPKSASEQVKEKLIDKNLGEVLFLEQEKLFQEQIEQVLANQEVVHIQYSLVVESKLVWFAAKIAPLSADRVVLVARDITAQKQLETGLEQQEQQCRLLANNFSESLVMFFDKNLRCTLVEGTGLGIEEFSQKRLEGSTIWEVLPVTVCDLVEPLYCQAIAGKTSFAEIPDESGVYLVQVQPITDSQGEIFGGMAIAHEITAQVELEEQLQEYTFCDSLTGLPNKTWFLERLSRTLEETLAGQDDLFAVFYIQLERFSIVKYSLGHEIADKLAIAAAQRLQGCLRLREPVAQVGDSALAILLKNLEDENEASWIAERIQELLHLPLSLRGHEIYSPVTIGIAFGNYRLGNREWHFQRPEDLLRGADTAMNHAKTNGKLHYAVFQPEMHSSAIARLQLETELRKAIESGQLQVFYQPIVCLKTGKIIGFEALVRWLHPVRGQISPNEFICLAEETGLIGAIDWWMLREACQQLSIWQQSWQENQPLTMSVNMSHKLLGQVNLVTEIKQILQTLKIEPSSLKLEVTERAIMENSAPEANTLEKLKSLGIKLSIDDFGTGYSCLERLHQLPIDTLKIDRSFVSRMLQDPQNWQIIKSIITLAHNLNMDAIAEGIETATELAELRSLAAEYGQGYFFSQPLSHQKAEALLKQQLRW